MVYTEYKQTGFYPERMFSMNKAMIFFGIAAAVGTGYILAKKYIDKNPEAVAAMKENCSDKLHKASVYCTGAVKTGSEKLTKSVNEIVSAGREKSAELMKGSNRHDHALCADVCKDLYYLVYLQCIQCNDE